MYRLNLRPRFGKLWIMSLVPGAQMRRQTFGLPISYAYLSTHPCTNTNVILAHLITIALLSDSHFNTVRGMCTTCSLSNCTDQTVKVGLKGPMEVVIGHGGLYCIIHSPVMWEDAFSFLRNDWLRLFQISHTSPSGNVYVRRHCLRRYGIITLCFIIVLLT